MTSPQTSILKTHLEKNGARVVSGDDLDIYPSSDLRRGYLVLPHDVEIDVVSGSLPERAGSMMNLVTNWWVERCLYGKRLVDPTDDVLSRPFDKLSINGKLLALARIPCPIILTSQVFLV